MPKKLTPDLPLSDCPVPAAHDSAPRKRSLKRSNSGTVRDAIGPIEPKCEKFCVTNGQFSLIDVLEHCLSYTGPATLDVATWTAADGDLRRAHAFLLDGRVKHVRLVVDP